MKLKMIPRDAPGRQNAQLLIKGMKMRLLADFFKSNAL